MKALIRIVVTFINESEFYESDGEMTVAFINQKQEIGLKR